VVWAVGDEIEAIVADLRGKGVVFEQYDMEGATFADGIHRFGDFRSEYDPSHPAANAEGYVLRPNVDSLVEAMDMREAQRAYEANLNVIETARSMESRTLDLLKR
jgi:flagellar basal-body rod protein FlgC